MRKRREMPVMSEDDAKKWAHEWALRRLGHSEISESEMMRYLKRKKIPADIAERVVADFVGRGYISDERYAAMMARSQLGSGKGPGALRMKLMQKGVKLDRTAMKELVDAVEGFDEEASALAIVERKYPDAGQDQKQGARAFQALVRRGFSFDVARRVLDRLRKTASRPPCAES